ncbi:Protein of unknown function [Sulfitobacter brevis]|uniref:DUF3987 domain-containing protein n=1 Tax=Sulfitobacter brevis TaxID=74348 RepID=A0A1I2FM93_9RHOB|nr:DUF3987 domain-containing protein [Sulfitobacter brevis]SFF05939.1 Protein of unknown function [Sulfitobacter brevis]
MTVSNRTKKQAKEAQDVLFSGLNVVENGKRRMLTENERDELIAVLALRERPEALSVESLIPKGSFSERLCSFFKETDASYALPLFQLISMASSFLTQTGATIQIPGLNPKRPILWTIVLASSGSSKTLATDKVAEMLQPQNTENPIHMFPTGATDAQWIIDLAENNGSYWYQDELGQEFNKINKNPTYARTKQWILDAYSNRPISNRTKGDKEKLVITDPHFTLLGLSVRETWCDCVDVTSMLDGFCQRFNYVIAEPRTDTNSFDHFLYFAGDNIAEWQDKLCEIWNALCAQEGASTPYQLDGGVLPYLEKWWHGLKNDWGDGVLPISFIRRTGFSILSYLVVLQFLLGKSNRPIDLETAKLATKYAEYHFESTMIMIREYGLTGRGHVEKVVSVRDSLLSKGAMNVTVRDIQRKLSKNQGKELTKDRIAQILKVLDRLSREPDLFDNSFWNEGSDVEARRTKLEFLEKQYAPLHEQIEKREKWRNDKRIQALLKSYRKRKNVIVAVSEGINLHDNVVRLVSTDKDLKDPCDLVTLDNPQLGDQSRSLR